MQTQMCTGHAGVFVRDGFVVCDKGLEDIEVIAYTWSMIQCVKGRQITLHPSIHPPHPSPYAYPTVCCILYYAWGIQMLRGHPACKEFSI